MTACVSAQENLAVGFTRDTGSGQAVPAVGCLHGLVPYCLSVNGAAGNCLGRLLSVQMVRKPTYHHA